MSIFRAYDIRGKYPSEINEELCYKIGLAYANYMKGHKKVLVGMDVRLSSPSIKKSLTNGLRDAGKSVIDIGLVPTPVLYFAIAHYKRGAGVMVTGSHLSKEYNGLKLKKEHALGLTGESGIRHIERAVMNGKIKHSKVRGQIEHQKMIGEYSRYLIKKTKLKRPLKVVIDSANGCCGIVAPQIFKKLGCTVIELNSKPDGRFPHHLADPHEHEKYHTMDDLKKAVLHHKADLGVSYDGDGDRSGYVDNKGRIMSEDQSIIIFARQALLDRKKGNIVVDVRISDTVLNDVKKHSGTPIMVRAGHSYIELKALRSHALFGAEVSGHMFFPYCYYPYDDGIFASLKMAEVTSELVSIASYIDTLPKAHATPELRVKYSDEKKFELIKELQKDAKKLGWGFTSIDGVRIQFRNGWALIRPSNTSPQVTMRFEGKTAKDLYDVKTKVGRVLKKYKIKING